MSNKNSFPIVTLKRGREESLLRRHPWVFSGAVASVSGEVTAGATVLVRSAEGLQLGFGAWSPVSQIRIRMWGYGDSPAPDAALFRDRLRNAAALRSLVIDASVTDAYRVVFSEADGLPGLIVDRYADWLVCQFLSAGVEHWREAILDALREEFPGLRLYERSDEESRGKEGMEPRSGDLGDGQPDSAILIKENGMRLFVDVVTGHKTGLYLDQRDNRATLREFAAGKDVLNCFSYTGGFAVAALTGGAASVLDCDASADALALARENTAMCLHASAAYFQEQGDVFSVLRSFRDARKTYDIIVLDPPKFAHTAAAVNKAARGYKDINLLAFKLLRPGGLLFTFSCSGHIVPPLFRKIVADAAVDAGVDAVVLREMTQSGDHPAALSVPESLYLKGLLCKKM
ncbi:MAG: class I SAM-dependent methyltransferase [Bacteroidia bacterium]|nr:class I SAM-dependent methyltransferase [Bacteroidia bacterium]